MLLSRLSRLTAAQSSIRSISSTMAAAIASQSYTDAEKQEIAAWTEKLSAPPTSETLTALDAHLATRSTLLGNKPSSADVAAYRALAKTVSTWTPEQRTGQNGLPNIVRLIDFVQNSAIFGIDPADADKVVVEADQILYVKPPVDAKAEKERLKKEKAAAAATAASASDPSPKDAEATDKPLAHRAKDTVKGAAAKLAAAVPGTGENGSGSTTPSSQGGGGRREKKDKAAKAPKQPAAPAAAAPLTPGVIDLRVGHILKAVKHPEADSLYVSTIAMGDPSGYEDAVDYNGQICRTVCSGLNGLVPLEDMQDRKVVVVANLKPVKMRGIKSCAMVLAASPRLKEGEADDHKGPVELVSPPEGSEAGQRVFFEGWQAEPEKVLNPKKKIWELFQPGFTTTEAKEVAFDARVIKELGKDGVSKLVTEAGGVCTVPSLTSATVR